MFRRETVEDAKHSDRLWWISARGYVECIVLALTKSFRRGRWVVAFLNRDFVQESLDFGTQVAMVLNEAPVPLRKRRPGLPEPLARVVHRALERDPADRFADVRAMRAALAPFAG